MPRRRSIHMDAPNILKTRHLWLVFFALFILWYILLYAFDWSSLNSLSRTNPVKFNRSSSQPEDVNKIDHFSLNEGNKTEVVKITSENDNGDAKNENRKDSCLGRYVFIHEIPKKFNLDIIENCRSLSSWSNMCPYMENMGLGQRLPSDKVFSRTGYFATNQFSLEIIFHNRIKKYECLTRDSSKASVIFVPYYAGYDVSRYLWSKTTCTARDSGAIEVFKWLRNRPEWGKMNGQDHFLVAGRIAWDFRRGVDEDSSWGNKLMLLPEAKNMTMLTIESSPWNGNDFAIPYPTYFHPFNDDDVAQWQNRMRRLKRRFLFSFAGAPRPNMKDSIRGEIMTQCQASRRKCRLLECKDQPNKCYKPAYLMKMFQSSVFCLQPPGDSFTRRSTFDSIVAGCIPVFFHPASAYVQYLWHLPKNYNKYSVLIPEDDVKGNKVRIEEELEKISPRRVSEMREEVIKLIPKVVYADPRGKLERFEDAFELTLKGVIKRVDSLRNSSLEIDEEFSWKHDFFGEKGGDEWDHYFKRRNNYVYQGY